MFLICLISLVVGIFGSAWSVTIVGDLVFFDSIGIDVLFHYQWYKRNGVWDEVKFGFSPLTIENKMYSENLEFINFFSLLKLRTKVVGMESRNDKRE